MRKKSRENICLHDHGQWFFQTNPKWVVHSGGFHPISFAKLLIDSKFPYHEIQSPLTNQMTKNDDNEVWQWKKCFVYDLFTKAGSVKSGNSLNVNEINIQTLDKTSTMNATQRGCNAINL